MKTLKILFAFLLTMFGTIGYTQTFTAEQYNQNLELNDPDGVEYGYGVSFVDFNQDGWDDLTFGANEGSPQFFVNEEGNFTEIDIIDDYFEIIKTILWIDYDNDGDLDLHITDSYGSSKLYSNDGDLNMSDVTVDSGLYLPIEYWSMGACWGDYDLDGYLDMYLCNYTNDENLYYYNRLYHNNGDGTFEDVTIESEIDDLYGHSFQSVWIDLDEDLYPDLHTINDRIYNHNTFFYNDGDGTFTENTFEMNLDISINAMTNSFADFDNDGDFDLYITSSGNDENDLMLNEDNIFTNVTFDYGAQIYYLNWAAKWMDFDNDMFEDLFVVSSYHWTQDNQNYCLQNINGEGFEPNNDIMPINLEGVYTTSKGDYNNDGFVDVMGGSQFNLYPMLYKNEATNGYNFLKIDLEGTVSNSFGIGTRIEVSTNGSTLTQYTTCGADYLSQDSYYNIFGLAENEIIDSLVVKWTSGHVDTFYDLDVNQTMTITEGMSIIPEITGNNLCLDSISTLYSINEYSSYLWSTGDTTQNITISEAGEYSLVVYNEFGVPSSTEIFTVDLFLDIHLQATTSEISCFNGNNGSINISVIGETQMSDIEWDFANDSTFISNLSAGTYSFSVTDYNGCITYQSFVLNQPDEIIIESSISNIDCFGICAGSVELLISGGTPDYEILTPISELCAGTHEIEILDLNNCETSVVIEINEPEAVIATYEIISEPLCFGECAGEITIDISGGIPEYEIIGDLTNLCAGNHEIIVYDMNQCEIGLDFYFEEPQELNIEISTTDITENDNGTAEASISGGTPPYEIEWSNGEFSNPIADLSENLYWIEVTDSLGCTSLLEFDIVLNLLETQDNLISIYPNPVQNELSISGIIDYCDFYIYDNLNRLVFYKNSNNNQLNISNLDTGMYMLIFTHQNIDYSFRILKN